MPKISARESFTVALISDIEKVWIRGGGGGEYRDFPSKNFFLLAPKFSRKETFYCCIDLGYRKSLDRSGLRGVPRLSVEFSLPHNAENFRR